MPILEQMKELFPAEAGIPAEFRMAEPLCQTEYLADGELRRWDGPVQEVYSPVHVQTPEGLKQQFLGSYPLLSAEKVKEVLEAAVKAYANGRGLWPTSPVAERIARVEEFALRMKSKRAEVVRLLMWEIGKSYRDAASEFDRTIDYIKSTAFALKDLDNTSSRFVVEQEIISQIRRAPLGVVLCMGPFNYPLNETFTTLIPAVIMGNTVICKPPKLGTLLYQPLLEIFRDVFPPGVVNFVYGRGANIIEPLMASGKIDVLAFIGTSKIADAVKKQHPKPHRLRSVLGLDAKNPAIIMPDADLDLAVEECRLGALSYNGQRCTALKIIFVHREVAEAFLTKFSAAIARLKLGMPWDENVAVTPLPETGKTEYLQGLVADAVAHGARVVNPEGGATYRTLFYPALLYPVDGAMRVYHEEQFGPVIPVIPFDDLDQPIRYIEESNYGQQVSLFGRDPEAIARMIDPLVNQLCRVNINSQCQRGPDSFPFTGRKDSAEGTLSVSDALRVFSIRTLVAAKGNDMNKELINRIVREHKSNFLSTDYLF
ncbi:glyceraldehyde-3-phosphate dehydrogenase (NADP+) [Hydrogenispora ethanolica]|uniref:Glyceraldehyde-3-phosphate dehydrogenase (NADP+) n=1 Tax=Hydrogenispora ethanolica TaxID=1082276 RepID=A0A4R1QUG2_HYDET|nr:NADP-dependent glyceraldehyde-3-phosphate dehydrogenase [Hydrogenispora ethanolica]TCL56813.1 glyceraldehyde-3-phosphate dehydrogenase (NADP+) [Hydrogenispora ethanolica]